MSLANKRNDYSESHNHNLCSGYHTEKHNPLTCASSPKETPVRLRSYDIETPEAPSGTPQIRGMGMALDKIRFFIRPWTSNRDKIGFRCDAHETLFH